MTNPIPKAEFDLSDPKNLGRPVYWDPKLHILAIEQMVRADEIQIALEMIEKVPAWYRENRIPEIEGIRKILYQRLYDQLEYSGDDEEAEMIREVGEMQWDSHYMFPRAEIIAGLVDDLCAKGTPPWIFDLGCSHGNLVLGLMKTGRKFSYFGRSLNYRIEQKVRGWASEVWKQFPDPGQKTILFCSEVIEHCMNPLDIVQSAGKLGIEYDYILLSVPYGCLGGGLPDWDTRRLGHVRGWGAKEFYDFADKHWPGYEWRMTIAPSMVLLGKKA